MAPTENETWLVETGDEIIQRIATSGMQDLWPWELLVHALWAVDYCIRNAGDLSQANLLHAEYKAQATDLSKSLALPNSLELFQLPEEQLAQQYLAQFETVCTEVRAYKTTTDTGCR